MNIQGRSRDLYEYVVKSIAFYPTLITFFFFAIGILMIYLEGAGISGRLLTTVPFLIISSNDTARTFLNTVAGGILSLTVFTFTMIMLVINQASSIYSPRVVPGFITQKKHQLVLGFYVGTVIYSLLILINVGRGRGSFPVPGAAVFLALTFGITCLVMFVYFIHSISRSVQIGTILERIYTETLTGLESEKAATDSSQELNGPETSGRTKWFSVYGNKSGYLQEIQYKKLSRLAKEHDLTIQLMIPIGSYLLKDDLLFLIDRELKEDDLRDAVMDCFLYYPFELVTENYLFGFKQITEIAVKALSPGINDPGTAINAVDYLTDLLAVRMSLPDQKRIPDDEGNLRITLKLVTLEQILFFCLSSIRPYAKEDVIMTLRLLLSLKSLMVINGQKHGKHKDLLLEQAAILIEDADRHIINAADRRRLNDLIRQMEEISGSALPLLPLTP